MSELLTHTSDNATTIAALQARVAELESAALRYWQLRDEGFVVENPRDGGKLRIQIVSTGITSAKADAERETAYAETYQDWQSQQQRISELEADAARLDWLETELDREQRHLAGNRPTPRSLFRSNVPITREAIDAARAYEREQCERDIARLDAENAELRRRILDPEAFSSDTDSPEVPIPAPTDGQGWIFGGK